MSLALHVKLTKIIYLYLWKYHLKYNSKKPAHDFLSRAFFLDTGDFELASQLGETYLEDRLPDKALAILERLPVNLDMDFDIDIKIRCLKSRAKLELGNIEGAASLIIDILEKNKFSEDCQSRILLVIGQTADTENCLKMANRLEQLLPANRHVFVGTIYFQQGEYFNAIPCLENLSKDSPQWTRDINILASCYVAQKDFSKAEPLYKNIVADNSSNLGAVLGLALCQYASERELGTQTCLDLIDAQPQYLPAVLQYANWAYDNKDYAAAEEYFRQATSLDPSSYKASFFLGMALRELDQAEEAAHYLELSYQLNRKFTEARVQLASLFSEKQPAKSLSIIEDTFDDEENREDANLLHQKAKYLNSNKDLAGALDTLAQAISYEPNSAVMYESYSVLLRENGQLDEAFEAINSAELLAPRSPTIWLNKAVILCEIGRGLEGLQLLNKTLITFPGETSTRWFRALYYLSDKQFFLGWKDYEYRWETKYAEQRDFGIENWNTEKHDETVLVYREQALGDEIMFSSCIPDIASIVDELIVECHPKLENLYKRSFPSVTVVPNPDLTDTGAIAERFTIDKQIACGSLPGHFRNSIESFIGGKAYLKPDPLKVEQWAGRLRQYEGKRLIGLSWRGGTYSTRTGIRSVPIAMLEKLFRIPDTIFFNLQYGDTDADLAEIESRFSIKIIHDRDMIEDYDETAAFLGSLDVVVSVQTSLVHLCGALGVPVFCMLPKLPEWRYGYEGDSMPWYQSVRLIRQDSIGHWSTVLAKVCRLIEDEY
jgi:hypothetical protein